MTLLGRRALLGGTAAAVAAVTATALRPAAAQAPAAPRFLHGVASGDPLPDAVVLWTRVTGDRDETVDWVVALDPDLRQVVRRGSSPAVAERDRTVKVDVTRLSPSTTYWYRFEVGGVRSPVGRTRTAPAAGDGTDRLRFAVVTCAKYDNGFFNAYARVADADVDAVLHCGDYVYEGATDSEAPPGRATVPDSEVRTLAEYRQRYAHYRTDPDLQRMHAAHPLVAVWDDHESSNDSWADGAANHDPATEGPWPDRKAASQRAYDEWLPVRLPVPGDPARIYRRLPYGDLVDVVAIDTRLEGRSQQLTGLDSDQVVVDPAVDDPARQMYSPVQRQWIEDSLASSPAVWKLLLNQVVVGQFRAAGLPDDVSAALGSLGQSGVPSEGVALAADTWDGYEAERERLLGFLRARPVQDVVVLTGDLHASLASDLSEDPYDPLLPPVAVEVVTPSVTSSNFDEALGVPPRTTSLAIEAALLAQNPGLRYAELDSNGYVLLDVTAERVQAEWWFVDTVREPSPAERLDTALQVVRGTSRLVAGGPATAPREERPPPPPAAGTTPPPPPPTRRQRRRRGRRRCRPRARHLPPPRPARSCSPPPRPPAAAPRADGPAQPRCSVSRAASSAACGYSSRTAPTPSAPPSSCARTNPGTDDGAMPAKVSDSVRARVSAGLAKLVLLVAK